ncbi:hypothetical protein BV210_12625 [Halorientalis sp. IM1011]|uniref:BGTF surface domain-containing protein n=1 Tax=Halorientalis sp. IM1011 TaxID=1932360 RepID=UPI00097CCB50|nr:BGTF surface domain-containing protein [Halorientalis sp. IM1011]AQL43485.1 hypothetical protein BV210_12625 [Halorientalis sp. IM1011]
MNDTSPLGVALGGIVLLAVLSLVAVGGAAGATAGTTCPAGPPHDDATGNGSVAVDMFAAESDTFGELATLGGIRAAMDDDRVVRPRSDGGDHPMVANDRVRIFRLRFAGEATRVLHGIEGPSERAIDRHVDRRLTSAENVSFDVRTGTCSPEVDLSASYDAGAVEYVVDARNRSIYVVLDAKRAVFEYAGFRYRGGVVELRVGDGEDRIEDSTYYTIGDEMASIDGEEPFHLNGTDNATVSGRTSGFPGTNVTVELNVSGEPTPRRRTVTVGPDWRFAATFDLSSVPANTRVVADLPGYEYSEAVGVVEPSPAFVGEVWGHLDDSAVVVKALDLSRSGHLVVREYNASDPLGGRVLGHTRVDSDDDHASIPVSELDFRTRRLVVVPVRDYGNETYDPETDRPFRVDGVPVRRVARVENPHVGQRRVTPTPTTTTESSSTERSTSEPPQSRTDRTARATTTGTGPGFGTGLAVLAVVAVAFAVRLTRR